MEKSVKMNLQKPAEICVKTCMKIKPNEKVLIVNENKDSISNALKKACEDISATAEIKNIRLERARQEPPEEIAEKMLKSDAVFLVTDHSLTHTTATLNARKNGARIASLPGITEDMFCRAIPVDYEEMRELAENIKNKLENNQIIKVKTEKGTDVELNMGNRKIMNFCGIADENNGIINLPDGEVEITPLEDKTNGKIVIDGCGSPDYETKFGKVGKIEQDIILHIKNGKVVKIEGREQAEILKNLLKDMQDPGAYIIAEFAIGINPKAKITDRILESEKVLGTIHFALGENRSMGGVNESKIHWDFVLKHPKIYSGKDNLILDCSKLWKQKP